MSATDSGLTQTDSKTTTTDPKTKLRVNKNKFHCNYTDCSKLFESKSCLNTHLLRAHPQKRFKCDYCEYRTNLYSHLRGHRIQFHMNEKNYINDYKFNLKKKFRKFFLQV
jgi:hypothetical protein